MNNKELSFDVETLERVREDMRRLELLGIIEEIVCIALDTHCLALFS